MGSFICLIFHEQCLQLSQIPKSFSMAICTNFLEGSLWGLMRNGFVPMLFRFFFFFFWFHLLLAFFYLTCSNQGFISHDRNARVHNKEVIAATKVLFEEVIPQCGHSLYEVSFPPSLPLSPPFLFSLSLQAFQQALAENNEDPDFPKVTEHMHRAGVNVRYIGDVIKVICYF